MAKPLIYDLDFESLNSTLAELDQPPFRTQQLWEGLYTRLYTDFSQFSNIPKDLRDSLSKQFIINPLRVQKSLRSQDGLTEKVLFALQDGTSVEAVLMRYERRNSLCISTQVGCPVGCVFCATGQMGFVRSLSSGEILAQVLHFMRQLQAENQKLTNIVYMGMGEPFLNYEATMDSVRRLMDQQGLNFGARRITISTVGIIPKIEQFTEENLQVNLAVSLHAADNALRSQLVPANRMFPINKLIPVCKAYTEKTHRRISFEYALIDGVNDSREAALALAGLLKGMLCHVNLIALNPSKKYSLQGSPKAKVHAFSATLEEQGIPVSIRLRRGVEIQAGCGQLAGAEITA
ncbi:MAG TPA: 23S rRNA (adenine(2503)-C(2))-methyltransferase RlmN [Anaerolineaceae bacterium]|nr:MAG: putative dual-specificity RNA methyltransferase RlmN [Anaerolineae bacterium 49_20]HAE85946.1 23S rRNA (adenine(2503)-C(2))-methyltransferase RlmN [Anaerolineaceae bacterium]